jgi:glycerol-3-phosphate dehydrogenase (NAD(P)+)
VRGERTDGEIEHRATYATDAMQSDRRIAVIGAGSWGTTVAAIVTEHAPTVLWGRNPAIVEEIATLHRNHAYLPDVALPPELAASTDLSAACADAAIVVMAVPSHGFRTVLGRAAHAIGRDVPIVSLSKGLEPGTQLRMTEVVQSVIPGHRADRVAVLTGPNLAQEVAAGQPAASVVACRDAELALELQTLFMGRSFRVYTNPDVVGCEIAGALKNVVAIAAGIAAGLGYGDNTQAALITRGLAELTRLGVALGGEPLTFAGLAGLGDLVATCVSAQSRNRGVGVELGRGRALDEVVAGMNMVAEGVKTTAAVLELAARVGVEMPIAAMVGAVLYEGRQPADLVPELMVREAKAELHGLS